MFCLRPAVCCLVCLAASVESGAQDHRFHQGQVAMGIPFELNSNKIYLPVRVNGGEQRWFILDSGCPVTAVDVELARQLRLPLRNERTVGGAGEGQTFLSDTVLQKLTLPGLDYVPAAAWAIGVNQPVSRFEGRRIDGLLGLDFLEQFVVRIDYAKGQLDVLQPTAFKPENTDVVVPVAKARDHYAVRARLRLPGGKVLPARFIVDIGVRLPLLLNTPFVNEHQLIKTLQAGPSRTVGGGLGGEAKAQLARLEALELGQLVIPAPYAALSQERRGAQAAADTQGILGAEVFRRYRLTLDLPGKRLFFGETPASRTPYEHDASGMFVVSAAQDFHHFEVLSVVPEGPAATAGIQKGDVIVALDGEPAQRWTLERVRGAFREANGTRTLKLRRNGRELEVYLQLQRQV